MGFELIIAVIVYVLGVCGVMSFLKMGNFPMTFVQGLICSVTWPIVVPVTVALVAVEKLGDCWGYRKY